jgi:hypothetical protein
VNFVGGRLTPHPSKNEGCGTRKIKGIGSGGVKRFRVVQLCSASELAVMYHNGLHISVEGQFE